MEYALYITWPVLIWWFSTGLVLYLDGLPVRTYRWSLIGATALLLPCLYAFDAMSRDASAFGACMAFLYAVLIWGWLEMTYLMGLITGPRKDACPPGCSVSDRFLLAMQTSLYHELCVVAVGLGLFVATRDAPNAFGAWAFAILWGMRWSSKLNIFLGVPNLTEEFWPDHLRYLSSYCGHRPMNLLFPVSISVSTAILAVLVVRALGADDPFLAAGYTVLASLMGLAVLEHWFLVLPIREAVLWRWATRRRGPEVQPVALQPVAEAGVTRPATSR